MSRAQISVLAAILTFSLGVFTALGWMLLMPAKKSNSPVSVPAKDPANLPVAPARKPAALPDLNEEIEIKFEGFRGKSIQSSTSVEGGYKTAIFKISNRLREPVYFEGYSNENTCDLVFYKEGERAYQPNCWCGTDLLERKISQSDFRILELAIPDDLKGKYQADFTFSIGKKRIEKTVRINVEIPAE